MEIAVFSDIHGNALALRAMLSELERREVAAMVCLGDVVQGGTQPRETLELVQGLGCPVVMGNTDAFVAEGSTAETVNAGHLEVREWTVSELGAEGVAALRTFVPRIEIDIGPGRRLLCCHGSPASFDELLFPWTPVAELDAALSGSGAEAVAGGHTHIQWTRALDGGPVFVNPGSVGLAYTRFQEASAFVVHPVAQYAVLHVADDGVGVEFCQAPYDRAEAARIARASGHPGAERLARNFDPS